MWRVITILVVLSICISHYAQASEVVAASSKKQAVLGSAYDSQKEMFVGNECMTGTEDPVGPSIGAFTFNAALQDDQVAKQIGFAAGGRARFGVVELTAASRFMKEATSHSLSTSAVWISEYSGYKKLKDSPTMPLGPTNIGKKVSKDDTRWRETCGDEYVSEITYGARLYFLIRVDFCSYQDKQYFDANFSLAGPLAKASGKIEQASQNLSHDTTVTINALQMGGDTGKVTNFLPADKAGQGEFVQCILGNFADCAKLIVSTTHYAANEFPNQLDCNKAGLAPIVYTTSKYSAAGEYPKGPPGLSEKVTGAREKLESKFEEQLAFSVQAERSRQAGVGDGEKLQLLKQQEKIVNANIDKIADVSVIGYDQPLHCYSAVGKLD